MEFVAGHFYKTRDGLKAQFIGETYLNKECPLIFVSSLGIPNDYCLDGRYFGKHRLSVLDIVSEWTEEDNG